MGSISRVKVYYQNLDKILKEIEPLIPVYGAVMNGHNLEIVRPKDYGFILMGNESHGISGELLKFVNHKITIPPYERSRNNHAESLNVAMATAIILYSFRTKT